MGDVAAPIEHLHKLIRAQSYGILDFLPVCSGFFGLVFLSLGVVHHLPSARYLSLCRRRVACYLGKLFLSL